MNDIHPERPWFRCLTEILQREPHNLDALRALLYQTEQRGVLSSNALAMMEGVLRVSETPVRDIMIPRTEMTAIPSTAILDGIVPIVVHSSHSRFPVIDERNDKVIGVLLAKDLLAYHFQQHHKSFVLKELLRQVAFIPESKRLDTLLQEFRNSRQHMAIVIDEYGNTAGLVTIEDVLEQIVGEISDEYDIER